MCKQKFELISYSTVLLIGVSTFAVGASNVCRHLAGLLNKKYRLEYINIQMSLATALCFAFIGLALFIIGRKHIVK